MVGHGHGVLEEEPFDCLGLARHVDCHFVVVPVVALNQQLIDVVFILFPTHPLDQVVEIETAAHLDVVAHGKYDIG